MSIIIQMYRTCQYGSWEEADAQGGIYCTPVHMAMSCDPDNPVMTDVIEAILNACDMMDGGYNIKMRAFDDNNEEEYMYPILETRNGELT